MAAFVLVSGACHAGWCWERVVPLLEKAGHTVAAPDLAGMGSDRTPLSTVTLALWADQIAALIEAQPEPVILVGHSRGGIVVSEAAERQPAPIRSLVYLSAFLVPTGKAVAEITMGWTGGGGVAGAFAMSPDGTARFLPEAVGPVLYNTTEAEWVERARARLGPEPMSVSMTPLGLTPERYGSVPRAYIECTEDRALPLGLQRQMQEIFPCDPVITLKTDHSPFYSSPVALADALLSLAD